MKSRKQFQNARCPPAACLFTLVVASSLLTAEVGAAPRDAEARRLDEEAMGRHFLTAEFKKARLKLEKALKRCARGCSAKVLAQLHRDLGVVLITGFADQPGGERELGEAIARNPKLELDPTVTTDEIRAIFARLQAASGEAAKGGRKRESELLHEPVTEQRQGTPIPIYAELPDDAEEVSGRLHYLSGAHGEWQGVRMKQMGEGFGAEIPCAAVRSRGTIRYFIRLKDSEGSTVASAGSRDEPFEIEISADEVDDPPHFPDRRPPKRCADTGLADCESGDEPGCSPKALRSPKGPPSVWLSVGLAQDAALVSGTEVCSKQSQLEEGFSCFRERGTQYHGTPRRGLGGQITTGLVPATTRAYLASDLRLSAALTFGMRVGYAIANRGLMADGGKAFFPMHGELRAQYWLSDVAFDSSFSTFLFASGGVAQIDAKKAVRVTEDRSVPPPPAQLDNPDQQMLDAYKKLGLSFAALGAGAYLPFGDHHGVLGDLKLMALFPDAGAALELELGYALGL